MPPKSLFRGPGAKHYAVVHRSVRDPLINDPEAGDRVLAEVTRANEGRKAGKGLTKDDLEADLPASARPQRANIGEASLYDIYYDDTEYDYMQHLRPTGQAEAVFIEAPERQSGGKGKGKARAGDEGITLRSEGPEQEDILPPGVRPTPDSNTLSYKDHLEFAVPANSARLNGGLQPDMDSGLREVLEALDDEEYVEEAADDDFFGGLVAEGERDEDDVPEWAAGTEVADTQWDRLVGSVKQAAARRADSDEEVDSEDFASEAGDTIADLRASSLRRPPRKGASVSGSAFSMSSSAMFRNEGLTTLDDRFDQIEKEYEDSTGSEDEPADIDSEDEDGAAAGVLQRADLDEIFDDFLDHYEVLGGKLKGKLEGDTPLEKLATMRKELARIEDGAKGADAVDDERARTKADILARVERAERREEERRAKGKFRERREAVIVDEDPAERWDCQTILSTYSNVSNHPRLLRMREAVGPKTVKDGKARISIDRKTGFPMVDGKVQGGPGFRAENGVEEEEEEEQSEDDDAEPVTRGTISRDKNEGKDDKKARKAAVKAERSARRQQKKQVKETFAGERKKQQRIEDRVASRRAADVGGQAGVMSLS